MKCEAKMTMRCAPIPANPVTHPRRRRNECVDLPGKLGLADGHEVVDALSP